MTIDNTGEWPYVSAREKDYMQDLLEWLKWKNTYVKLRPLIKWNYEIRRQKQRKTGL